MHIRYKFGEIVEIHDKLLLEQAEFLIIQSQTGQNDLEAQSQWLHFQYHLRVSHNACLVQIWWLHLKYVSSYHTHKLKFRPRDG